ncbi:MAG: EcsC family protein [Rhodothermales bacterium]
MAMRSTFLKLFYKKALKGLPMLGTPTEVAQRYAAKHHRPADAADRIINRYTSLGGATGFVSGLPGWLLLPITLPANLVGTALLQLHMTAALASLGGYDLSDRSVRARCIDCLLDKVNAKGKNTEDEEIASRTGLKLAERATRFAVGHATKVTSRYATRKLLGRVPLIGGVIGAGSDAYVTRHIGQCAKSEFITKPLLTP